MATFFLSISAFSAGNRHPPVRPAVLVPRLHAFLLLPSFPASSSPSSSESTGNGHNRTRSIAFSSTSLVSASKNIHFLPVNFARISNSPACAVPENEKNVLILLNIVPKKAPKSGRVSKCVKCKPMARKRWSADCSTSRLSPGKLNFPNF